jgi:hemerythrin
MRYVQLPAGFPTYSLAIRKDRVEQITWTEEFSVGVARLDRQHKRLIQMTNRLIATPQTTTDSELISDILSDMTNYAQEHFAAEEELMRQHDYPRLEEHIAQHRAFQKTTVDFCSATMLNVRFVPESVLHYLSDWLVDHILDSDMAYKPFFHERRIE